MENDSSVCGKRAYGSEREALDVAEYRMSQGADDLTVYHCLYCGCFHLTSG